MALLLLLRKALKFVIWVCAVQGASPNRRTVTESLIDGIRLNV
jgi:hypothetical protein